MPAKRPVIFTLNGPLLTSGLVARCASEVVGLAVVLQQIPLSVTGDETGVMSPLAVAVLLVTALLPVVVTFGTGPEITVLPPNTNAPIVFVRLVLAEEPDVCQYTYILIT